MGKPVIDPMKMNLIYLSCMLALACSKSEIQPSGAGSELLFPPEETAEYPFPEHALLDLEDDTLRYLALGDSYTIGEAVPEDGRWPVQLAAALSGYPGLEVPSPQIIAQTGWTTANLSNAMNIAGIDEERFDLVSLLIGVNNQYQNQSIGTYAIQFAELLERAINIANGDSSRVFVVSIPDYGYTPFGLGNQQEISMELEAFNAVCRDITLSRGVAHYDITPISQQWPETEGLVAPDGLHPSAYQYSLWVDSFVEGVRSQLP